MAALPVEFHSITDDISSWPPEISGILRALDAPLPSWCATAPYNGIPPPSPDSYEERTPRLADVSNLALSTVSDIRSLIYNYGPTRSALSFVSILIQGLAYACRKEAVILKDVAFVRPRNTTPERGVDGLATLLACYTVDGVRKEHPSPASQVATEASATSLPSVHPSSTDDQCSSASLVESENSDSSGSPLMQRESFDSCSSSPSYSGSVSSIDVPPEAHILPGRGRHLCAVLPFLCVADVDNMADLMSSVACQRHVWGIMEPAVGFVLSETGVVAKVVLSWLDASTGVVHIVRADDSQGVFDLQDFTMMLSFSQFIMTLSPHFAAIFECTAVSCEDGKLDWRSDRIHKGSDDLGYWQDRVERWVYDVELCGKRESLPPHLPSAAVKSPGILRLGRQPNATDHSEPPRIPADKSQQGTTTQSSSSQKSSQSVSCSNLASMAVTGLDAEVPHILTWMFDRRASSIGRISFLETTEKSDQIEINENIAKYDAMCGFLGTPWNENQRPPVDAAVTHARDILVKQVVEQQAGLPAEAQPTLSPEHQRIMCGRLSTLLFATLGAYTLAARSRTVTLYEAEFRHDWDALLYYFYHGRETGISPSVFFEHTIHLARNTLADTPLAGFSALCKQQLQANADQCYAAFQASLDDPSVSKQAVAASAQANVQLQNVSALGDGLKSIVGMRSAKEPNDGRVDAVMFISIDDPHDLKNEEIIRYNKKVSSKPPALLPPDKLTPEPAPSGSKPASSRSKSAPSGSKSASLSNLPPSEHGAPSLGGPGVPDPTAEFLQNPFYVNALTVKPLALSPSEVEIRSFEGLLLLPHATAEYKKADKDEGKPLNQGRMYLVSVASFYSTLGIDDYPFYCLVTSGKLGAVLMAWKSSKQDRIYIMERNVVKFDISSPIEAFQFATFLLRLHDDSLRLAHRVTEKLKALGEKDGEKFRKRIKEWKKWEQKSQPAVPPALPSIGESSQAEPGPQSN
ncbi:hypothetical protein DFH06DRAFT_1158840 [Mycena polygramma]|nr:hypothetical protein DFH06DRAFT_1158840 [Mycena polygramma]